MSVLAPAWVQRRRPYAGIQRAPRLAPKASVIYSSPLSSELAENEIIREVIAAAAARSWEDLKLLLHPYFALDW